MSYATYEDVLKRWTSVEELMATEEQVTTLLEDAEDRILIEFPTLESKVTSGELRQETVIRVEVQMVMRHLKNPDGVRSAQMGAGPFQQTTTYGGEDPGTIYLTDDERRDLRGSTRSRGKVFMVDTVPPCSLPYDGWWC
ncbi:Gp19/Gp15/Gp42 family protein [Streptomyces sp. NPDC005385]|uniref:Gp19/Gp15/Gp42 family protein n=1 Tax=Streptomyces sp. NPDC005385 TaxID=3157039 RepID=UPI0033BD0FA4